MIADAPEKTAKGYNPNPACTDCGDTGITFQTERRCSCQEPSDMTTPDIAGLVQRLRKRCNCNPENPCGAEEDCGLDNLAAATLEHLEAENARLREALKPFANLADVYDPPDGDDKAAVWYKVPTIGQLRKARAALGDTPAGLDRQGPLEE